VSGSRSGAHGVNANQVLYWRKLYQAGRLGTSSAAQLLPVRVYAGEFSASNDFDARRSLLWAIVFRDDSHRTAPGAGAH
jgi:hypothetical protein